MDMYLRCVAAGLLCVILSMTLRPKNAEIATVLSVTVCCMILYTAVLVIRPVMDFLKKLQTLGNLNGSMVEILLKVAGIGFIGEIAAMICADSANSAVGKALQTLAVCVILWLSLPLFSALLELVERILGGL